MSTLPDSKMTILNAAAEIMVELEQSGKTASLSLGTVAKRAGVSRTTVYRHFSDRDGLLAAVQASHGLDVAMVSTRARILSAFGRMLRGTPLKAIKVEDVAIEAGVSAVTVYRQFDDRVGLAQTFFMERGPRHDAAELLVNTDDDPVETLVRFVTRLVTFMRLHRSMVLDLLMPDEETRELMASMRRGDKRTHLAVMKFMADQIERGNIRGSNPKDPAMALFSMVLGFAAVFGFPDDGNASPAPTQSEPPNVDKNEDRAIAKKIVDIFWNGFGT